MFSAKNYLNKVSQTPKDYYCGLNQATVEKLFGETTQLYTIKEQSNILPFTDIYNEIDVWLSNVSDDLVNTSKVYSDFVEVFFKDYSHNQNYKGQYYKINLDDEHEETYICYDRINKLDQVLTSKLVRCNNVLTWKDEYGNIITMPCYLGTDISSTNNLVSSEAIVPNTRIVILIQANNYTMNIRKNQRFMFQHSNCFKVEEVNNYMQEQGTNGDVTCVKIYIDYSPLLPSDNKELNICDYYSNVYNLKLDQENTIVQQKGFNGTLNAIVTDSNGNMISTPLIWTTSDSNVVTIDNLGNYKIIGDNGKQATIKCTMSDNDTVYDEVIIEIADIQPQVKSIVVLPSTKKAIKQGKSQEFKCAVYIDGDKQSDSVTCIGSGADEACYTIEETIDGYIVTNKQLSTIPLTLTFKSEGCEDVVITVGLLGRV